MSPPENGRCYFCNTEVDSEAFCFGCEHFVCEMCNHGDPWDKHEVKDHLPHRNGRERIAPKEPA